MSTIPRPRPPGAAYTLAEAAALLRLSPRTLRARITQGLIPSYKDGGKRLISEAALSDYQRRLERQALWPGSGLAIREHFGRRA